MTLQLSDLSVLAYANNFTLWHYKTEDDSITTENYFNNASDMINANDLIIANVDIGSAPATQFYIVTDRDNGVVTIKPIG